MLGEVSMPSYCTGYHNKPLCFSKVGNTVFRETLVQQPKTAATLSCVSSFSALVLKVGQSEAPSSTTASIFLPSTPPFSLISSIAIIVASFAETSLIAIVPVSECKIPTLTVSPVGSLVLAVEATDSVAVPVCAEFEPQPPTASKEAKA